MSQEFDLIAWAPLELSYVAASGALVLTAGSGSNSVQAVGGAKVWTIQVSISAATTFSINNGTTSLLMNGGANLAADTLYTFTFIAHPAFPFTFRFGGNCTVRYFVVGQGRS